jgi:hypothetical protein
MIVYLYFKDRKNCENCEKINVFFFKCKMLLKKCMRVPLLKAPQLFSIENMPRYFTF